MMTKTTYAKPLPLITAGNQPYWEAARAHELKFPLPMAAIAHQLFLGAAAMGLGNQDDASVVKLFEKVSGVSVAQNAPRAENDKK